MTTLGIPLGSMLSFDIRPKGFVRQTRFAPGEPYRRDGGVLIHEGHNLVVDSAFELMASALIGDDSIRGISFGLTGGRPISPGLRTIGTPVATTAVNEFDNTKTFLTKDGKGLRSIITWTGLLTAGLSSIVYDTVGLVSSTNLLFAAKVDDPVTVAPGETIAVQWTVLLRGAST